MNSKLYLLLKEKIHDISTLMFDQICIDMDSRSDKKYNYYFALVNEVFKGLELCCNAIDIQAYSQVGTLLRQLIEQVAISKIIGSNKENLLAYIEFAKAKQKYIQNNEDLSLQQLFDNSKLSKNKRGNFLEYSSIGWLENIGCKEVSYNKLLEIADIVDLYEWRGSLNNFVHTNITYMQFTEDGIIANSIEFIYIMAVLLDVVCCSYHNVTKYNFDNANNNMFFEFRTVYSKITKLRNEKNNN